MKDSKKRLALRAARVYLDLSQEALAAQIGVSQQTLAKYENGQALPRSFKTINELSRILNVPKAQLFPDLFAEGVAVNE